MISDSERRLQIMIEDFPGDKEVAKHFLNVADSVFYQMQEQDPSSIKSVKENLSRISNWFHSGKR